jgi:DNA (cytosine-5)-methyltransferase 1
LMKYLSVCSGIEAATVAWHPLGWQAVGYSEIEKFPSQVLAHHYPNVPNCLGERPWRFVI